MEKWLMRAVAIAAVIYELLRDAASVGDGDEKRADDDWDEQRRRDEGA
jgi:hypothetical protein